MAGITTVVGVRRLALVALAAGIAVAGTAAVVALLNGSFGEGDGRVVAASLGFGLFSATAATGAAVRLRPQGWARLLGAATIGCSLVAFGLLVTILTPDSTDGQVRTWAVTAVAALWTAHAAVVLGSSRHSDGRAIRVLSAVAITAMTVAAIGASLLITHRVSHVDVRRADQELAAVFVGAVVASVLLPILRRLAAVAAPLPAGAVQGAPAVDAAAARLAAVATTPQLRADLDLLRGLPPDARASAAADRRTRFGAIGMLAVILGAAVLLVIGVRAARGPRQTSVVSGTAPRAGREAPPVNFAASAPAPSRGVPAPERVLRRAERDLAATAAHVAPGSRAAARCRNANDGIVVCDLRVDRPRGFSAVTQIGHYDPRTARVGGLREGLGKAIAVTARHAGTPTGPRALLTALRPVVESCFTATHDYTQCMRLAQLEPYGLAGLPVSDGDPQPRQVGVITATVNSFTLMALTNPGASFTLAQRPGGRLVRTCEPARSPGCSRDGTW